MTEKSGLADRHLRLVAGLWFAAWIGSASLLVSLVVSLIVAKYSKGNPLPPRETWLAFGLVLGAAGVAGGWLGAKLLKRGTSAVEAVRRGAWIGILTGVAQVFLGSLLRRATFGDSVPPGSLYSAVGLGLAMSAVFRAGWLLPIGALAGSSLVRVTQLVRTSERDGSEHD
jgi:hypothetical protein